MKYQRPKGTRDILPDEAGRRFWLQIQCRQVLALYGFREIEIPTFEQTELFSRSIGEASDIVVKEMYTFTDKGGRSLTLRPESTAGIIRAVVENAIKLPARLFHFGPMFRQERPQKGRFREFYQLGVEAVGLASGLVDAELIEMATRLFKQINIRDFEVAINTVGCPNCAPQFKSELVSFLAGKKAELCEDCNYRLERNPLRVFDCKNETCRKIYLDAPKVREHLCPECHEYFEEFQEGLKRYKIDYRINDRLVRGIDYYTRSVFEFVSPKLGAQDSLGGGGRYDNLVEELGGPKTPATGFALGIERLLLAAEAFPEPPKKPVFIIGLGEKEFAAGIRLSAELKSRGVAAVLGYDELKLKPQLRQANISGARYVVIIGPDEIDQGVYALKDMETGEQKMLKIEELIDRLKR
jgi:histidyl-tRNA synthetase